MRAQHTNILYILGAENNVCLLSVNCPSIQLISFRFEHAARIACSVNAALVLIRNTEMISVFKARR